MMTIEEAKLEARKEIEFSDLLNRDGIRALKDGLDSDKYALLENLIAELQELKDVKVNQQLHGRRHTYEKPYEEKKGSGESSDDYSSFSQDKGSN